MHAPAIALASEFWHRHRLGLSGVVALVIAFVIICALNPLSPAVALANSMWFAIGLCYVIGVFAYGFDGKLESAESGFPARLFLLPVRTAALVGWPMLQGALVAVLLWLAWALLVLRPCGVETPAWAPVMLAAGIAVSQALVWLPFGVPWVRLAVMVATLLVLVRAPAFLALAGERYAEPDTQDRILSAFAAALLPIAFLVAYLGVSRARRGDTPDWLRARRLASTSAPVGRAARPFRSALRAQMWYEWRARGRGFAISIALILLVLAGISAATERDPARQTNFGVLFLLIPALIAAVYGPVAGTAGASGIAARSFGGLSAFAATRPLSNVAFVVAKCRAAGVMAAAAWVITLTALVLWLIHTGGHRDLNGLWAAAVAAHGAPKVIVGAVLLVGGPVLLTWRTLVVGLWTGLSGRSWVPTVQLVLVWVLALQAGYEMAVWQTDTARRERILAALPWLAGFAVAFKIVVAAWAFTVLHRRGELSRRAIARLLVLWTLTAATLLALAYWLIPSELMPTYALALSAVLIVPLARPLLAPLALAWNRHR